MGKDTIKVLSFTGEKVRQFIPQIADLRVEVFPEYPFLYIGDYDYEKRYLEKFTKMKDAIVVLAFDGDEVVGLSTGYPFSYEAENFLTLFRSFQRDPKDYYCFGESVLRKSYRGQGIGKQFFDQREAHVQKLQYKYICFFTIVRSPDDPKRPPDYRPLDSFWKSRGFVKHPELIETLPYQEIGEEKATPKEMVFWIKEF